ncbi:MAG TPA: RHS repeat-associated core domain-containing protein [Thermoanaerobaculia bacterium]|nr:RHS repeat-associated core domain-containing protein [Thermoanaerobaculia bacterium]
MFVVQSGPSWDSIHLIDPLVPGLAGQRLVFSGLQSGFRIHSIVAAPSSAVPSPAVGVYFSRGGCGVFGTPATLYKLEAWPSGFTTLEVLLTAPAITCPRDLAVTPDGSLYVADQERILRVAPGQGVEAVADRERIPGLIADSLAVGGDGSIYYARSTANRVWRLAPTGELTVVAGTGTFGFSGDGGPAPLAQLRGPERLLVSPEGFLFILDGGNHRIRRVDGGGFIHTYAGDGRGSGPLHGAPALATSLGSPIVSRVGGMGLSPGGDVLFTVSAGLWRVTAPLPGFSLGEQLVAGEDGGAHVFSPAGRHLRTLDGLTGEERLTVSYDPDGRLAELVDEDGNRTRIEREGPSDVAIVSPFGERTDLALDENGFLASVTNPAGETHRFEYGAGGLLTKITTPRGHSSEYTYSLFGRLLAAQDAAGGTKTLSRRARSGAYETSLETGLGVTTSYGGVRRTGSVTERTVTTPAGLRVDTVTQADGRRITSLPDGTVREVEIGPDPRFGMSQPLIRRLEVTTPSGLTSTLTRVRVANLTQSEDPLSLSLLRDTWTLNGRRRVEEFRRSTGTLTSTSPEGRRQTTVVDALGRPVRISVPGVEDTSFAYDGAGRVSRIAQGTGDLQRAVSFGYDDLGRLEDVLDPLGRSFGFAYDEAGRVIRQTLPDGRTVAVEYDENGNPTAVVPPGRPPHFFRYTPVDAVEEYEPPELDFGPPATTYSYDRDRRLVEVTRPDGKTVGIAYDPAGRPETILHPAGVVSLAYEPDSGQLSSVSTGETAVSYAYDGSLLTGTTWSGPVEGTVGRTYDENFWLRARSVNGSPITFDYDDDGLLTRAGELAVSLDAANGRVLGATLGAVETSFSYDPFGDLETMAAAAGGGGLYSVVFERDLLGRIAAKTETLGGLTNRYDYHYDAAGRLERVERDGAAVEEYLYDDNGNRLTATYPWGERHGVYDDQDRLLAYGDATFTYTENGELLARTEAGATTGFEYDAFGALRRVELPSGDVLEYVIDGRNRRVGRKVNGALVEGFLYADALNPVAELDGNGAVAARFVYGTRANVPEYMVKAGTTYRLVSDHLGSVRLVVDAATGAVAQRLDYDSFGRAVLDTNPGFQPFGFAGGIYDPLTGLVRFGARDYDPNLSRWTAKDPILFGGGDSNLSGYVLSDPINKVDLAGEHGVLFGRLPPGSVRPGPWRLAPQQTPQVCRPAVRPTPPQPPRFVPRPSPTVVRPNPNPPWYYHALRLFARTVGALDDTLLIIPFLDLPFETEPRDFDFPEVSPTDPADGSDPCECPLGDSGPRWV